MQVMQLKIGGTAPLSIDDGIATSFPKVKASKAYLNDAGDAAQNLGNYPPDDAIATGFGEGKQSISQ